MEPDWCYGGLSLEESHYCRGQHSPHYRISGRCFGGTDMGESVNCDSSAKPNTERDHCGYLGLRYVSD